MAVLAHVILGLFLCIVLVSSAPTPGGSSHKKIIIHVPIKYHTIHHVKIQKVPFVVKKHVHHHKYPSDEHHHYQAPHLDLEEEIDDHGSFGHGGYDRYDDSSDNGSHGSYENNSNDYHYH